MAEGEGMHGRGACVVGGMHGRGHVWQGACMAGGVHGGEGMRGRYYEIRSMSGRYTSYWNAFLYFYYFKHPQVIPGLWTYRRILSAGSL